MHFENKGSCYYFPEDIKTWWLVLYIFKIVIWIILFVIWQQRVSDRKCRPDFTSVLLYFFWSFGINDSNTFSIENLIQLRERCCTFHYISWTDSIQPGLQFASFYFGLFALEGSTFSRFFFKLLVLFFINNLRMGDTGNNNYLFE